jgi:hypothetical protein
VPLVTLITHAVAYGNLMEHGVTTWDRDAGFCVRHGTVGAARTLAAAGWFALFYWLLLDGSLAQP